MKFRILKFDEVGSTNDMLKDMAKGAEKEGTVIVADSQSRGRGRMGRSFHSPSGTGLYMSILFRPSEWESGVLYTTRAAVAVAKALEKNTGRSFGIKWVNDIYLDGKKVCGILAEGGQDENGEFFVVLGIGINLVRPRGDFPEEIRNIATACFERDETFSKDEIINDILTELDSCQDIFKEYVSRDILCGCEVDIISCEKVVGAGRVIEINPDFSLKVELFDGRMENFSSGEVSVRKK